MGRTNGFLQEINGLFFGNQRGDKIVCDNACGLLVFFKATKLLRRGDL